MSFRSVAMRCLPLFALLAGCGGGGYGSPMPAMSGSGGSVLMPTDIQTMSATSLPTPSPTSSATPTAPQIQPAATAVPASVYTAGAPDVAIPTATRPAQFDPSTSISSLRRLAGVAAVPLTVEPRGRVVRTDVPVRHVLRKRHRLLPLQRHANGESDRLQLLRASYRIRF